MIAALSDTDAHIVLSALCKANQRNGRKDKNDETSQIRGMKGPLLEQNSSYWATLALNLYTLQASGIDILYLKVSFKCLHKLTGKQCPA